MADRKEQRERRRAERMAAKEAEQRKQRLRLILGYAAAGLISLAVVVGLVVVLTGGDGSSEGSSPDEVPDAAHVKLQSGSVNGIAFDARDGVEPPPVQQANLEEAARAAGCKLQLNLPNEGDEHLEPGADPPDYSTSPPTSGNHVGSPHQQADGAYSEMPDLIHLVHSLEHGRIQVQYSPDLPEQAQLELKGLFDASPEAMMLFPNERMPFQVAATAWRNLLGCSEYRGAETLDAIRAFRDVYRGRGPEQVPVVLAE